MRVALAGYSVSRTIHAPLLHEAGAEIVAISTRDPEKVALAVELEPQARIVDDLEALLEVAGLDVVVLTTPTGLHHDHALRVIAAGIPVVVDKPLSVDAEKAAAMVAAARAAGVPMTVFQNRRYDPGHRTARHLARSGAVGEVRRFEMRWERWRPQPKHRWREAASASEGGGVVLDLQSHLVDAAIDVLGPVASVYATIDAFTTPADDDSMLLCRHVGGAVSVLNASSVCAAPGPRLRMLGSAAGYVFDDFDGLMTYPDLADEDGYVGWLVEGDIRTPVPEAAGSPSDFYTALATALTSDDPQAAMPVNPDDAVAVLRVLDAARVSARTGEVVTL